MDDLKICYECLPHSLRRNCCWQMWKPSIISGGWPRRARRQEQERRYLDLLKFGLIPEFIGRVPVIVTLDALDKEALIRILTEPKNALIKQYQRLLKMDQVELEFTDESLVAIADAALARNTGARGLRSIVEKTMNDIMYEVPSNPQIEKVIIHKDCITEGKAPEVILHKKTKMVAN